MNPNDTALATQKCDTALAPHNSKQTFRARADVYETKDAMVVLADMPGVSEKDVEITLEHNTLTLRGPITAPEFKEHKLAWEEYAVGDYERVFKIGNDIQTDAIAATLKNGVLKVTLPKAQQAKARKISVLAQ